MLGRTSFHQRHTNEAVPIARSHTGCEMGRKHRCLEHGGDGTLRLKVQRSCLITDEGSVTRFSSSSPATTCSTLNQAPNTAKTTTTSPKLSNSSAPSPNPSVCPENGRKRSSHGRASSATSTASATGRYLMCCGRSITSPEKKPNG